MNNPLFIAGCGYVGCRLIAGMPAAADISVLSHSPDRTTALTSLGVRVNHGNLDRAQAPKLADCAGRCVYYFVPPPADGSSDPRLSRFLAALPEQTPPDRIILISATGVYGDCHGDWVDEHRPPAPNSGRGRRRLDAEQTLLSWSAASGVAVAILRVAGIYGPDRLPRTRLEKGLPVLHEQESPWSNRIHIDDLVQACIAAQRSRPGGIYNIADGHPSTMTDYFNQVADHLGLPRPPTLSLEQARQELSAGMLSYLAESRRLDNTRLRRELGVELKYPTLAQGLAAS